MRIIVAAASQIDQRIIENTTRKAGYTPVHACASAQQVFDALEDDAADLVVADKHLSDINAIQLAAHLQKQPETVNATVVILADEFTSEEAFAAIKAGAEVLLIKPVLPNQLREKIAELT